MRELRFPQVRAEVLRLAQLETRFLPKFAHRSRFRCFGCLYTTGHDLDACAAVWNMVKHQQLTLTHHKAQHLFT
ncbi:hypothetical protein GCM10017783_10410 [Deinococcus piscis]|uniref:Transposase n=1 Tax=Deinococcus piscis TaxID=394230 RepID=A0ABQ3K208_9DEIO|nr:hypothetical protein GCM10017783_10410 [Deinococcus piscis]